MIKIKENFWINYFAILFLFCCFLIFNNTIFNYLFYYEKFILNVFGFMGNRNIFHSWNIFIFDMNKINYNIINSFENLDKLNFLVAIKNVYFIKIILLICFSLFLYKKLKQQNYNKILKIGLVIILANANLVYYFFSTSLYFITQFFCIFYFFIKLFCIENDEYFKIFKTVLQILRINIFLFLLESISLFSQKFFIKLRYHIFPDFYHFFLKHFSIILSNILIIVLHFILFYLIIYLISLLIKNLNKLLNPSLLINYWMIVSMITKCARKTIKSR